MNARTFITLFLCTALTMLQSCKSGQSNDIVAENFNFAAQQLQYAIDLTTEAISKDTRDSARRASRPLVSPRTLEKDGSLKVVTAHDWTSGFFPGELWFMYEMTNDPAWEERARKFTEPLQVLRYHTGTHDLGFMMYNSFGNGLRLTGDQEYREILLDAARSLATRYKPGAKIIRSWDHNGDKWQCPVIIDNMMNLELLFNATKLSGDSTFYKIAVSHADQTMKNHYRPDFSTWHVVDYNPENGTIRHKNTHQGYSDESSWARGQSWGIYGFVMCYRETNDPKYLHQAEKALEFVANHPNYPDDGIPYWDYDAPDIPNTYRDASAAAILASALYEISAYSTKKDYKAWADNIIKTLASPAYRAKIGENGYFLLMHSVGSLPHNSEVDVPLNYADYYFLEALKRKRELEK